MRLRFLFVGKTKSAYLAAGVQDYLHRIQPYVPSEEVVIKGVRARDERASEARGEETRRLLAALRPDELFVHLDPDGREFSSLGLARWLKNQMDGGAKAVAFGLGGPQGLDDTAAQRANLRLSLSKMTLTHEMCRLVLLEQVYRALRINAGHPYHK